MILLTLCLVNILFSSLDQSLGVTFIIFIQQSNLYFAPEKLRYTIEQFVMLHFLYTIPRLRLILTCSEAWWPLAPGVCAEKRGGGEFWFPPALGERTTRSFDQAGGIIGGGREEWTEGWGSSPGGQRIFCG